MPEDDVEYVPARPPVALAPFVRRYLGYREYSATPLVRRQTPVATCALIITFGHPIRLTTADGTVEAGSFVAGMADAHVITEFVGDQYGLQVDLTPLGLYTLLGRPMSDLTNRVPALDELSDRTVAALPGRLASTPDWPTRFDLVTAALADRLLDGRARRPDPEVAHAWARLAASGGTTPVAELARETGWSRRHLLTRFRAQIGLAPKATARVLRFQRACGLLVAGPDGLADIAATCGYADQPHLVREFRTLSGLTPTALRQEWHAQRPDPTVWSLDVD